MKIKYIKGNLLDAPEKYILHGCNAQGKMGSGVAKLIRAKWPSAYDVYKASAAHNRMRLGSVTYAEQDDGKIILNGVTQEFYGRDGKQYVDYDAVKGVIEAVNWFIYYEVSSEENFVPDIKVAMPKIGAGLGGGEWEIISKIIEQHSTRFQPVVYSL